MITPAQRAGRTEEQWDQLVTTATEELVSRGGSPELTIHYSDLNNVVAAQTGQPTFDLSTDQGRWALGPVLGEVNDRTYPEIGALLSALVWHKGSVFETGGPQWGGGGSTVSDVAACSADGCLIRVYFEAAFSSVRAWSIWSYA